VKPGRITADPITSSPRLDQILDSRLFSPSWDGDSDLLPNGKLESMSDSQDRLRIMPNRERCLRQLMGTRTKSGRFEGSFYPWLLVVICCFVGGQIGPKKVVDDGNLIDFIIRYRSLLLFEPPDHHVD
jgi:hypothetical protein